VQDIDEITGHIVDAAVKLHNSVGPGLLESVYESVLAGRLRRLGLAVQQQKSIDVELDEMTFKAAFRVDLLIEDTVIVEIKSIEHLAPVHTKQLVTYLRVMNLPVGLLINFGAPLLRTGIRRVVNGYKPSAFSRLRVNRTPEQPAQDVQEKR